MGGRKPTLGYPSRTAAVLALGAQGLGPHQIAEKIGVTTSTVAALEHGAGRRRAKRPAEAMGRTVLFPIDILESLRPHAERRGVTANELARRIVETVADDDLVDAVLDDGEEDSAEDREAGL